MELDWHHQTSPDIESTREEERRTVKKLRAARHGVGRDEDGVGPTRNLSSWRNGESIAELLSMPHAHSE